MGHFFILPILDASSDLQIFDFINIQPFFREFRRSSFSNLEDNAS